MSETAAIDQIKPGQHAKLKGRPDLGAGEVLRVAEAFGTYQADVVFETETGRRLETLPGHMELRSREMKVSMAPNRVTCRRSTRRN